MDTDIGYITKSRVTNMRIFIGVLLTLISLSSLAQKPVITAIDKTTAGNQDIVTFQGSSFGTDATRLSVFFGASRGSVNFVSDQLLEVKVPSGSTYDKISLTNTTAGLTEYSTSNFLYSFGGEHGFEPAKLEGQKDFNAETGLYDLCMCDFDRDGKTDIVTANDNSNSMTVLANTSTAPGLATVNFNKIPILLNARSLHVTCGDLNGDGKPDMVVSEAGTTGDRIFIFQNTSTGAGSFTFNNTSIRVAGKKVKRVKIADLDLDGKPEVIVTNQSGNNVTILVNQSTPASIIFSTTTLTINIAGAASTDGVIIEDLNGDHLPEVVLSQFLTASSNIFILRNNSTLGNISLGNLTILPLSNTVVNLRIGDLDNDRKPDIAATQLLGSSISIFLNQTSAGSIAFSGPNPFVTEERPWGIEFGDLDGDGKTDIAVASLTRKSLTILNNESTPGNLSFQNSIKPTTFINRHLLIGDVDGDAKPDIAFTSIDDNNNGIPASKISIFRNKVCLKPVLAPEGPHNICAGFPLRLTTNISPGTTYQWKNGTTIVASGPNPFFDVTVTGNYTVTAIAEAGTCSLTSNAVTVTVNPGTTTGTAIPTNNGPICIGSTLTLAVNDVGGTQYQWTGPEGYSATGLNPTPITNFQQIQAGRYNLDVIVGSCVAQQVSTVVEVVAIPDFQINTGGSGVVCPPATKTLTLTPALGSFTYQWFEKTSGLIAGQTTTTFNAPGSGEYYVEAKYTANPSCATVETAAVKITFASTPVPAFNMPATGCAGQDISFTNTSTTDPAATPAYSWEFGDADISSDQSPVHKYLTAANFSVKLSVSYSNGACNTSLTKNINIQAAPAVNITNPNNKFSFCPGSNLRLDVLGSFTSYKWSTNETTSSITVNQEGTYSVEVTTSAGCTISASRAIAKFDDPDVVIEANPSQIREGQTSQLTATGLSSYLWEPAGSLSEATISNPVASPPTTTIYTVSGSDINGCEGEATFELVVIAGSIYGKLTPSKFFSPDNGDEVGKIWMVERIEDFPQCQVTIYDDKGVKVHEAKPYTNDWDGTSKGKKLPDGVYYFVIKCDGEQNSPKTGSITILR
jgi:gliding motility-associated-like protein